MTLTQEYEGTQGWNCGNLYTVIGVTLLEDWVIADVIPHPNPKPNL